MRRISERLAEQAFGRSGIAQAREHEVDRGTGGIDGSVEVAPPALDTNVGFIDTPGLVGGFEMTAQPLLQFGTVALDPAPDGRVVRFQAALAEQLFDIAERERIPKIPAHGAQNQLGLGLSPLEDRRSDCLLHDLFRLPAAVGQSCNTTFRAEFCAPAKGWEKGSVETGVKYVRNLVFRPRLAVESWAALNALLITELEADLPPRHLDDGRPVQEAWRLERQHLRALPVHRPATCRIVARVADKFGHVRVDHETYSVPIRHAYRPVWVKLYHDRVAVAIGAEVVAQHPRAFRRGAKVLDARHVLPLLERKHRAVPEATTLRGWRLAPVWQQVRAALATHTRKPDQEWVRMLRLMETHPAAAVEHAVAVALERHSLHLETVRLILRQQQAGPPAVCRPVAGVRPDLARIDVPTPTLAAYDALVRTC